MRLIHRWRPQPPQKSMQMANMQSHNTRPSRVINGESYLKLFVLFVCSYYELLLLKNNISCVTRSTCTMEGAGGVNVCLEDRQHWDCACHFANENSEFYASLNCLDQMALAESFLLATAHRICLYGLLPIY
jgi:hypothetical protein